MDDTLSAGHVCSTDRPCWHRMRLGDRKVCEWHGVRWVAWRMGWDLWNVERDGREVSQYAMTWEAVGYLVGVKPRVRMARPRMTVRELPDDFGGQPSDAPW